ncbi:SDR family oxidoreductase [Shewanella algae]|uniref:SDR family oxidoreductase n=1 Tax=Shewanella algae TaxID=38313 RepID=UPI001AAF67E0|nr:sugar nucleotide-binding protein [Shewanella algae]MBO2621028.1 sugar nucleotide-binding protein [Shewanella algae]WKC40522.1 sugar nucleotide-binding protein [Shewanella algae]
MTAKTTRILITGAHGQLGQALLANLPWLPEFSPSKLRMEIPEASLVPGSAIAPGSAIEIVALGHQQLDLTSADLPERLSEINADVIINCAAYNAVDAAEQDMAAAMALNAEAPERLAIWCRQQGAWLIHISSDYVFGNVFGNDLGNVSGNAAANMLGNAPRALTESDVCEPLSLYGQSKLAGEQRLLKANPGALVLRTSWLYSRFGSNFVLTMRRLLTERPELKVVADQVGTPTWAEALARLIWQLLIWFHLNPEKSAVLSGCFHYAATGQCSWYLFTQEIAEQIAKQQCNSAPSSQAAPPLQTASSSQAALQSQATLHAQPNPAPITPGCRITPVSTVEYGALLNRAQAPRPAYSALDSSALKDAMAAMPSAFRCYLPKDYPSPIWLSWQAQLALMLSGLGASSLD